MKFIKRLKNLWELSAYKMIVGGLEPQRIELIKDFPTIEKKLATIIQPEGKDPIDELLHINDTETL